MAIERGGLALRLGFLALLGGGLLLWAQLRKPRDLELTVDLTQALPGELTAVDVIVRRSGHVLTRKELQFTNGAPGELETPVYAAPGEAQVEVTLVAPHNTRRSQSTVKLSETAPARVTAR